MRELAAGVHMLGATKGGHVRAYLLETNGELSLVDTLFDTDGARILEQIELIGTEHGRPLRFEELTREQAAEAISPYAPADVLFATWEEHLDTPAPVTDVIERLTGRPGRTPQEWARAYPI